MIESLAAISLAGNIIQFISFSSELLSKSREIYHSASGISNENVDLKIISQDIGRFSDQILSDARSSGQFSNIASRCKIVAVELLNAIEALQPKSKDQTEGSQKAPTKWQSFRKALQSVWEKQRVEELKSRLDRLRDQVTTHMISNTSDNVFHLLGLVEKWKNRNVEAGYKTTEQIRALDIQLQDVQKQLSHIHNDGYWKNLHDHFSRISSKVQQMSKCHTIIESLRYDCIQVRQDAIKIAHRRTFDWIFNSQQLQCSDRRSKIAFTEWLQNGSGIYWVTGKPGSGKSTLMKYLYDHKDTIRYLQRWSRNARLVKASFYFWNPGEGMQKSLEGLLQSLLYHVLHACPDLAPNLCSERWNSQQPQSIDSSASWTLAELQTTFAILNAQSSLATKFYFHVDGLDEYHGDHWDVIETLKSLATSPNVKLCLSSRPWNCFEAAFGRANPHILQLHDLTRGDSELFARENLMSYSHYTDFEPSLFEELVRDIGDRAQGVFLWVRLVVLSLRDGIINEDPVSYLQKRLQEIPSDLEPFFEHILGSVENIYQTRMASTFLAAIRTHHPLKMIHYYFLEQDDTTIGLHLPSKLWRQSQIQRRVIQTHRRLNGRFKGLLEPAATIDIGPQTTVNFLHRTLRDFLATGRMKEKLESWAAGELNVLTAISRALVAESKFISERPSPSELKFAVELASQACIETGDSTDYFAILDQIELACEQFKPKCSGCSLNCLMVQLAVSIGHMDYLRYRLQKDGVLLDLNRILKHAVLCSSKPGDTFASTLLTALTYKGTSDGNICWVSRFSSGSGSASVIGLLLDHGADPNARIHGASSWDAFLGDAISLMDSKDEKEEQLWSVLELFLKKGVDLSITTNIWYRMLNRPGNMQKEALRNTLRYFKRLFIQGLNPNARAHGTTITTVLLRTLATMSPDTSAEARSIHTELLREFLRFGADVSRMYKDASEEGWLKNISHELSRCSPLTSFSSRNSELRMFLEHGLDPNALLLDDTTVWEHLLDAIHSGLHSGIPNISHQQAFHHIILLALNYGANPHASKLHDILKWIKGESGLLLPAEVWEIERALQKEMNQATSQVHLSNRLGTCTGAVSFRGHTTTDSREDASQGQKRSAGHMSHFNDHFGSKRGRLR